MKIISWFEKKADVEDVLRYIADTTHLLWRSREPPLVAREWESSFCPGFALYIENNQIAYWNTLTGILKQWTPITHFRNFIRKASKIDVQANTYADIILKDLKELRSSLTQ